MDLSFQRINLNPVGLSIIGHYLIFLIVVMKPVKIRVHMNGGQLWESSFNNLEAAFEIMQKAIDIGAANEKMGIYTVDLFDFTLIKDVPIRIYFINNLPELMDLIESTDEYIKIL